jgi:hypothetical protein
VAEAWAEEWCENELGSRPAEPLLEVSLTSDVLAFRLEDGREVVVKRRPDEQGRAASCVAVQRQLADSGFPCARPLTAVTFAEGYAIHAEAWQPGGEILRGDSPEIAALYAAVLADLMSWLARIDASPPLPNPEWVRWEHDGSRPFAPNPRHEARADVVLVPDWLDSTARRVQERLRRSELARVLGHADWEAQNLRFAGTEIGIVHDWDSLGWLPESAFAGAAATVFSSVEIPTVAPLESSRAFIEAYELARGRRFTREETEVAWAASMWPALHNARGQALWWAEPVALPALEAQVDERLRLANA